MLAALLNNGCTIAPNQTTAGQASFDPVADAGGNYANSGVLGVIDHRYIITETARARYNALIVRFGARLTPPLTEADAGLVRCDTNTFTLYRSTNLWFMDKYHVDQWATMNRWANNPPPKPPT